MSPDPSLTEGPRSLLDALEGTSIDARSTSALNGDKQRIQEDSVLKALRRYERQSQQLADALAKDFVQEKLNQWVVSIPELLKDTTNDSSSNDNSNNSSRIFLQSAMASSDSIFHSLSKIASGGSQASQEIRQLETQKSNLDHHADCLQLALQFRKASTEATASLQAQAYQTTANTIQPYLQWKQRQDKHDEWDIKCREYCGEYAISQLDDCLQQLQKEVLGNYEKAVQQGDLQTLGQLTPVLSTIQLQQNAVSLYLQYLRHELQTSVQAHSADNASNNKNNNDTASVYVKLAKIYNAAVQCLRHHLPMVSHCLYQANGDIAVVQLVHVVVEDACVQPLLVKYQQDEKQLPIVSQQANRIAAQLEERYTGRGGGAYDTVAEDGDGVLHGDGGDAEDDDDCGFSTLIGSLADVDAAMEEVALCIQHSESYLRFMQHTCSEVNKARKLRFENDQKLKERERERQEWEKKTNKKTPPDAIPRNEGENKETAEVFEEVEIFSPHSTQLHLVVAEIGGQYATIERCLLLASMQRAFVASPEADPRYFRPLSVATTTGSASGPSGGGPGSSSSSSSSAMGGSHALQTAMVDTCFYAARRSTQRAFATGHTGTASAMTNFCVDCLSGVLLEVLSQQAEEAGVALLKPGDGLLVGSTGIFNASNLIRHGTNVGSAVVGGGHHGKHHNQHFHHKDELLRKQQIREGIAKACATLNDLEVAAHHTGQLEAMLTDTTNKGFPPGKHDTEQLQMCVKQLRSVIDSFRSASDSTIESLESVLSSRIRTIVGDAVGTDASSAAAGFMGSYPGKGGDRMAVRMNYNLDDDAYNLMQLSESYIARLSSELDELMAPLRNFLAPRLWDKLLLDVMGTVCKRLETSLRKCEFTSLGALALDSDMRDLLSYTKDRLYSSEFSSNVAVTRACVHLARLSQIAKLLNVDDLDDVLDMIASSKRKNKWDLKAEDAKSFLSARVEFDSARVTELLQLPDED